MLAMARPDPITIGVDGSIQVDASKLDPPPNSYDADYAWIASSRPGLVSIFFDKLLALGGKLRTRFVVQFADDSFFDHFWGNSREFHKAMRTYVDRSAMEDSGRGDRIKELATMQAEKEFSVWANFDVMSHTGNQALVDFYFMPPFGLARFARGLGSDGLTLTGVVRVNLLTAELCNLLEDAAPVAEAIEQRRAKDAQKVIR